jgi:hypothetical protein
MTKIGLFLGAGASMPFGKPTTAIFKDNLSTKYEGQESIQYLNNFLNTDTFEDIEHVLQSIKEIRLFLDNYGGKFFSGSQSPFIIENNQARPRFDKEQFLRHIKNIENIIKDEIFEHYRWDDTQDEKLKTIFDNLFGLFTPKDGIHVFTTNYDNAIETYCDNTQRHKLIDGFKHNARGRNYIWEGFFEPPDHDAGIDVFLHKLHGSLDWKQLQNGKIIKTSEESKPADPRYNQNMVIYPTLSPKEEELLEPYNTIIQRFKKFMKSADMCIVIGYSFRDALNETFLDFLRKDDSKLIIISPTAYENCCEHLLKIEPDPLLDASLSREPIYRFITQSEESISHIRCIETTLNTENIVNLFNIIQSEIIDPIDVDLVRTVNIYNHPS